MALASVVPSCFEVLPLIPFSPFPPVKIPVERPFGDHRAIHETIADSTVIIETAAADMNARGFAPVAVIWALYNTVLDE